MKIVKKNKKIQKAAINFYLLLIINLSVMAALI